MRVALLCVLAFAAGGSAAAGTDRPALSAAELIAGPPLPYDLAGVEVPEPDEVFALDADMRAFVQPLARMRDPRAKLVALLRAMDAHGLFSLVYIEATRTPAATFHSRQANCLSFTTLFITLARAAGLTVAYQTVDVPPTWSNDGQVVIANHVNAVVRTGFGEETIVDFNVRDYEGDQRRRQVSDAYALALFYANLGAEALLREDRGASFALLREAARVAPEIAAIWGNLGVLYARERRYDYAEAAYLHALATDESEPSALVNLALVYDAIGETKLASLYRDRAQRYRERNPYYHFALATQAYEESQFDAALSAVRKALRLKSNEHEFHELRGRALEQLGREREAGRSFARAEGYAAEERARREARAPLDTFAQR